MALKAKKIVVAGASGFLGRNFTHSLTKAGYKNVIVLSSKDYDLTEQIKVRQMFADLKPEIIINLAGYVGGILANKTYPADFCYRNLIMNAMLLHEAYINNVEKIISCIGGCSYPANAQSPIKEENLWEGYPQKESGPYSVTKRMVAEQGNSYRQQYGLNAVTVVPGNMYGPYDNFSLNNSHVIPALIRKFYEAKKEHKNEVVVWGSGKPTRDFVFVEDVAECLIKVLEDYNGPQIINISSGTEVPIRELVETISELIGFDGSIVWDSSKPDGQMRKIFDVTKMKNILDFECRTDLRTGLKKTIQWFEENYEKGTVRL